MRSRILFSAIALFAFAVPGYAYRMTAWVPSWDPAALSTMQLHAGNLQETNPGWFTIAADGTYTLNYKADDPTMRAALTGTQLVPTIKNYIGGTFDGALVAAIVGDPNLREKHAEALTQMVVTRGFDGIDIDYESVPASAKANFSFFIHILADKLHAARRVLSVTVHAKTAESTRNGPGAQDWRSIGSVADSVKIMAYDKHWSTSEAGAIAPLDWLDQVAAYATSTIPAGKAIIGLPWYGYDWLGTAGKTVTYASAMALAQANGATIGRDPSGEATFTYAGRTVYFQDAVSYEAKVDMITKKHPAIAGFAHWRVGSEDPAVWSKVRELTMQAGGSAPAGPAAKTFTVEGPKELRVVAGETASAIYAFMAINGFDATVNAAVRIVDPFGGTAALSTPAIDRTAGTRLTVSVPRTTPAGTYRLAVKMTGDGVTQEKLVTVKVTEAATSARRRAVR